MLEPENSGSIKPPSKSNLINDRPEIVIGLIGAVGADLKLLNETIVQELVKVGYVSYDIRVSQLLKESPSFPELKKMDGGKEDERIDAYMSAGDKLRNDAGLGDVLIRLALAKIANYRQKKGGEPFKPLGGTAYILNSLKHPNEIESLKKIYGDAFIAVSLYSPKSMRREELAKKIQRSHGTYDQDQHLTRADELIKKDAYEAGGDFGQNVRDTFPLSDFFVNGTKAEKVQKQIERFVQILFNHPYRTPTVDEYGMFHANAAALRSSDLSRQVGAVITTDAGEMISAGCNETPKAQGGSVWEHSIDEIEGDYRDFNVGYDSSARMKNEMISEMFSRLKDAGWLADEYQKLPAEELARLSLNKTKLDKDKKPPLKGIRAASVLEYGRIVHAEMSAITDAARRGLGLQDQILYCTTFPCHMCARHIIASGIKRVIYIEPYPKSMAKELYKKSICVDHDENADENAVQFEPFMGVAPTKYMEFFQMPSKRKDSDGHTLTWIPNKSKPRVSFYPKYLEMEKIYIASLSKHDYI